jgi:hypothetical protein
MLRPRSLPVAAANTLARPRNRGWLMAIGFAILAFAPGTASAQLIDPSTLQIGPGNTTDPVEIGNSGYVTVSQISSHAADLNTPWQLIIGIPNVTSSTSSPIITSYSTTAIDANGNSVTTDYSGPLKASTKTATMINDGTTTGGKITGQEAYTRLGYSGTDKSNNFVNWSGAETMSVSSFQLYEYNIPVTLSAKGTDSFQFSNLPGGTFVIAYGLTGTQTKGMLYDTPFTHAGMITGPFTATPEPSTLAIGALGALGFIGYGLRRRLKK